MDHDPLCQFPTLNLVCQCVLITRVREDERDRIWNRGE